MPYNILSESFSFARNPRPTKGHRPLGRVNVVWPMMRPEAVTDDTRALRCLAGTRYVSMRGLI
eukprot:1188409-Prymnesium_polylepis.1